LEDPQVAAKKLEEQLSEGKEFMAYKRLDALEEGIQKILQKIDYPTSTENQLRTKLSARETTLEFQSKYVKDLEGQIRECRALLREVLLAEGLVSAEELEEARQRLRRWQEEIPLKGDAEV
jgi:SPX domain protein involved in polyphosphate accumulation